MQLDIKVINKVLSDLSYPYSSGLKKINTEKMVNAIGEHNGWEGSQGDYNESATYYSHPELPENIFVKVVYRSDSYGNNDSLHSVEFVQGKAKTVTVYEPI